MSWRIEVKEKQGIFDAVGAALKKDIADLGIENVVDAGFVQVYTIEGAISGSDIKRLCEQLLVDPVSQDYSISQYPAAQKAQIFPAAGAVLAAARISRIRLDFTAEVAYNPGVMDPVEASTLKGINDLGISGVTAVKTAKKYLISGKLTDAEVKIISDKLLYNKLIQHIAHPSAETGLSEALSCHSYNFKLNKIDMLNLSDKGLRHLSGKGQLFLNLQEMRRIQRYFKKLGRLPTDVELETIAQTWSEHCAHKTFRGKISYTEKIRNPNTEYQNKSQAKNHKIKTKLINNLLKSTIMKATRELKKPWCVSVFSDNSGIIEFDESYNVCFKVETHNHPSALEPFGGANTGVGGVIRDCLGTGLAAKPIFNTDVFCFGPPDQSFRSLPRGTLHPKRIAKGVVAGVRDYGNKMGIPTINGAVLFDPGFICNPLVYCGTAGILPKDKSFKKVQAGDSIVVAGGRTGRDGIHGATFSSGELTGESEVISSGAVQIGNPIEEKKLADTIIQARDKGLYTALTDCGAGGLSSAVGEMGGELGARVDLDKVPLKYLGLSYAEIWISESQERMVLSVPQQNIPELMRIFENENVEAAVIGEFTGTKRLQLYYQSNLVCDLDMQFLHHGLPRIEKKACFIQPKHKEPKVDAPVNLTKTLLKLLSSYDICSKEWIIRQYDHEVQGASLLKPLCGVCNDGPSDAAVVRPVADSNKAVVVSCGINFRFGFIDPYWMAASCIDEALRQVVSVGADIERVALLDNFCWGNPDKPDRLGSLVRAALGCYDIAKAFGVPFISGKDSLYNEYRLGNRSIAIPATLLISAIGVFKDISGIVSMYAKKRGSLIYVVGMTYRELGGSAYYAQFKAVGNSVPRVDPKQAKVIFRRLTRAAEQGLVNAMHDCSDGGLAVALAEMAFSGGLGMDIFLSEVPVAPGAKPRNDIVLFSESNSRFVVEVNKSKKDEFEKLLKGVPFGLIGCVSDKSEFKVYGLDGSLCVGSTLSQLKQAWQKTLSW